MISGDTRDRGQLILVSVWLIFTVSFAVWWLILSVDHIDLLAALQPAELAHWQRQRRMVFVEGSAWVVLLILGGAALASFVRIERARARRTRQFFASFSHEVKTSLASLRLQTETLKDDLNEAGGSSPVLDRLVGDTVRLQLQLENSLFLSSHDDLKLFTERVRLSELIERMREQWPTLELSSDEDCVLFGDVRALRTIFSNLIQNALVHGEASAVRLETKPRGGGLVGIRFQDNGRGFEGATFALGRLFERPKPTSGSGLGLYICRLLTRHMGGSIELHAGNHGFRVDLVLKGELR